ncbi:hypothetical protein [Brevundimonas sp. Root1423]|uniref:hypothetical protein n=1 Tax=Brevundimonas sp. Root1423 TaxID=1736462 RepID=UPI00070195E3|nr:hypothetical protein [Brevundimonas sp. Root1423]KQY84942.1 hypothetical protein ASD25_08005 [Brevundimonas sp. Root1423]
MKQLVPAASALALILAACSPEAPPPADAPAAAAPAPGAPAPAGISTALLEADGVTLANPAGGADRKLTFGEAQTEADAVAFVAGLNGGQPLRRGSNEECGAGPLTFAYLGDWFELAFSDGQLAGWTASEGAPRGFATASGVHVGSTLAELRAAHPDVTVTTDTLGPEFAAGEIFGFLSGTTDAATVTSMWAGVNCVFR